MKWLLILMIWNADLAVELRQETLGTYASARECVAAGKASGHKYWFCMREDKLEFAGRDSFK